MIHFECPGCAREYNVTDNYGGKVARCKICGTATAIPRRVPKPMPVPIPVRGAGPAPKLSVRTRRLMADLQQMRDIFGQGTIIRLKDTQGNPAELYQIEYQISGVERLDRKQPVYRQSHIAEIQMTSDYPRLAPKCRMLTPIFHPNVDETSICVGDHWTAGERLTDLAVRIAEMIAYQAYNVKSPLNAEAAMWADLHPEQLPTDRRNLEPAAVSLQVSRPTAHLFKR
jgi:ubiquitin-protein ligase